MGIFLHITCTFALQFLARARDPVPVWPPGTSFAAQVTGPAYPCRRRRLDHCLDERGNTTRCCMATRCLCRMDRRAEEIETVFDKPGVIRMNTSYLFTDLLYRLEVPIRIT